MKKKIAVIATAAALTSLMIVGGTLAWFTDSDAATNVITTGNIDIELTETDANGQPTTDGREYTAMPGAELEKDPTITNVGDNDAYVRATVEVKLADDAIISQDNQAKVNAALANLQKAIEENMEKNTAIEKVAGYWYYVANNGVLAADEAVTLFETVSIPGKAWGNEMSGVKFDIDVTVEAIQVDNLLPEGTDFSASALSSNWDRN